MATLASPSLTSLSHRLALIVAGLRHVVAVCGGRDRERVPLLTLAWTRLGRLARRFEALVARLVDGQNIAPGRQRVRATRVAPRPAAALRLPAGEAWLIRLAQGTAAYAGQVQALLADPDMAALLAEVPNAGRILRPLCRMLGIEPGPPLALPSARKSSSRVRVVKPARVARVEPPTAISLACEALLAQAAAVVPEPVKRRPPWPVDMSR